MPKGTCEFCGLENVEIDLEHVIPGWMAEAALSQMNAPHLVISRGNDIVHRSRGRIGALNIEARCACKLKCNNGWMGHLEMKVSDFAKPMVLSGALTHLNSERQKLLTAWAVKTVMTHEFYGPHGQTFFTLDERKHLRTYLLPPPIDDLYVWLGRSGITSQATTFPIYLNHTFNVVEKPTIYALTLVAGQFLLQFLAYRRIQWEGSSQLRIDSAPFRERLLPLWPRRDSQIVLWPPRDIITDDDFEPFVYRFFGQMLRKGVYSGQPTRPL